MQTEMEDYGREGAASICLSVVGGGGGVGVVFKHFKNLIQFDWFFLPL